MYTRRQFLNAAAAAVAAPAGEARYQLGCQTLPYRALPLARAIEGIHKAGYRYISLFREHAGGPAFHPGLSSGERAELRRRLGDAGLTPFLCSAGMGRYAGKPEGVRQFAGDMDLAREFGIRTVVSTGPWYFTKFPNIPKSARVWQGECDAFYPALEQAVRHAESIGVTITMKPHTGITAHGKACLELVKRIPSERLKISWDPGNVSFYEGIWPDPDLPDLAPHVKSVCIKDHRGLRGVADFPLPGTGQIDFGQMFRTLFAAGFNGPLAVERVDGTEDAARMPAELIDQRIAEARQRMEPLLEKEAG